MGVENTNIHSVWDDEMSIVRGDKRGAKNA
jgi:hypothetical protein